MSINEALLSVVTTSKVLSNSLEGVRTERECPMNDATYLALKTIQSEAVSLIKDRSASSALASLELVNAMIALTSNNTLIGPDTKIDLRQSIDAFYFSIKAVWKELREI